MDFGINQELLLNSLQACTSPSHSAASAQMEHLHLNVGIFHKNTQCTAKRRGKNYSVNTSWITLDDLCVAQSCYKVRLALWIARSVTDHPGQSWHVGRVSSDGNACIIYSSLVDCLNKSSWYSVCLYAHNVHLAMCGFCFFCLWFFLVVLFFFFCCKTARIAC